MIKIKNQIKYFILVGKNQGHNIAYYIVINYKFVLYHISVLTSIFFLCFVTLKNFYKNFEENEKNFYI